MLIENQEPAKSRGLTERLVGSRLPSFARASLNPCHPEDRWFFLRSYRNPLKHGREHMAAIGRKGYLVTCARWFGGDEAEMNRGQQGGRNLPGTEVL